MVRKPRRKRQSRSFPVIAGVWCALLAAYAQVACEIDDGGSSTGDAGTSDAASSPSDASYPSDAYNPDAASDATNDSSGTDEIGDFNDAAGQYNPGGAGCGLSGFGVAVTTNIVLNPFGSNGAVTCKLKAGSKNVCEADNLTIFSVGQHHCSVTETAAGALRVDCSNPQGGSCTQNFTRQ